MTWKLIEKLPEKMSRTAREFMGFPVVYEVKDIPMPQAAIMDDTIMADGRPAHAWWCELEMLRKREPELQRKEMVLAEKFATLRIIEWAVAPICGPGMIDDVLLIKVKRAPLMMSKVGMGDLFEHPEKYCEVLPSTTLGSEQK